MWTWSHHHHHLCSWTSNNLQRILESPFQIGGWQIWSRAYRESKGSGGKCVNDVQNNKEIQIHQNAPKQEQKNKLHSQTIARNQKKKQRPIKRTNEKKKHSLKRKNPHKKKIHIKMSLNPFSSANLDKHLWNRWNGWVLWCKRWNNHLISIFEKGRIHLELLNSYHQSITIIPHASTYIESSVHLIELLNLMDSARCYPFTPANSHPITSLVIYYDYL